eukprot:366170-Chlamydomonas_euryale.AAC.2
MLQYGVSEVGLGEVGGFRGYRLVKRLKVSRAEVPADLQRGSSGHGRCQQRMCGFEPALCRYNVAPRMPPHCHRPCPLYHTISTPSDPLAMPSVSHHLHTFRSIGHALCITPSPHLPIHWLCSVYHTISTPSDPLAMLSGSRSHLPAFPSIRHALWLTPPSPHSNLHPSCSLAPTVIPTP